MQKHTNFSAFFTLFLKRMWLIWLCVHLIITEMHASMIRCCRTAGLYGDAWSKSKKGNKKIVQRTRTWTALEVSADSLKHDNHVLMYIIDTVLVLTLTTFLRSSSIVAVAYYDYMWSVTDWINMDRLSAQFTKRALRNRIYSWRWNRFRDEEMDLVTKESIWRRRNCLRGEEIAPQAKKLPPRWRNCFRVGSIAANGLSQMTHHRTMQTKMR